MSKQSVAKITQGYVAKVVPMTCSNCQHCEPVMGEVLRYKDPARASDGTHLVSEPVSQRCAIGGFAVKKLGSCDLHARKA